MEPRIKISYDIEENGALIKKELPFTVGVIGDFAGNNSSYSQTTIQSRDFIPITSSSVDDVIAQMKPSLAFTIDTNTLDQHSLDVELTFNSLNDFKPEAFIHQIPQLKELHELRNQLKEQQIQHNLDSKPTDNELLHKAKTLLAQYMGENNVI